jgi:hypothetical protein
MSAAWALRRAAIDPTTGTARAIDQTPVCIDALLLDRGRSYSVFNSGVVRTCTTPVPATTLRDRRAGSA